MRKYPYKLLLFQGLLDIFRKLLSPTSQQQEIRILLLGIDNAGKVGFNLYGDR